MKVSVIVPARNAERTIGDCLAALEAQDFPREDYEVIVVDDGSTDRTAEVAAAGGARVLRLPPSGPAAARNRGAAEARGEILAFTDADCAPDPGWLKALSAPLLDPKVSAAKGTYRTEQSALTARFVQLEYASRYRRMARLPSIDFIDTYSAAFRRSQYLRSGGCDETFPTACTEDQELGFRYVRQGGVARFAPDAVVRHLHADSPWKYFRKKLKIGFWKARVLRRHPSKAVSDSHTPPAVKVEMACALLVIASTAVQKALGPWPLLLSGAIFGLSALPLLKCAFKLDPRLGFSAAGLIPLRAFGLGLGLLAGTGALLLSPAASVAAWAALVLTVFLASTEPILASALGFFTTALLLALTAYAALFTGFRILRRLDPRLPGGPWDPLERTAMEFGLGAGVLMASLFGMGLLGLYRPAFAFGLLAVLLLGPHRVFLVSIRSRLGSAAGLSRAGGRLFLASALVVGGMTFFESLAPATAQDALAYHLAVPQKYIAEGRIAYIPESFFAQFPANVEMLFTLALLLRGSGLAGAYHWMLGLGATLAVAALARRLSPAAARGAGVAPAGLAAAAVFATMPTAALIAGWAYVDLGLVLFELLSTLAFLRWWELGAAAEGPARGPVSRRAGWLVLSGVLAGLAAGCKYTGGAQAILIVLGVLGEGFLRKRRFARAAGAAVLCALAALLPAAPWWIKNAIYTGNPLFPFLHGLFNGRDWDAERAATLSAFLRGWGEQGSSGLVETLLLPWHLTMSARFFSIERFDGMIGPAFLIGGPVVLWALLRSRRSALHVAAALSLGHALLWLCLTRQVRFLLPALAIGAALIDACLPAVLEPGRWRALALGALRLGVASNVVLISLHFAAHNPLPVVLGIEPEEIYLQREVPGGDYAVFDYLARELPPESHILFGAAGNPGFLCKRRYHEDPLLQNRTLCQVLSAGRSPSGVLEELRRRGFTHLLFRWGLVFDPSGRRSEIPLEDQKLLAEFLNRNACLLKEAGGTFLYRLEGAP